MKLSLSVVLVIAIAAATAAATAAAASPVSHGWARVERAAAEEKIVLSIAVKQRNVDVLEQRLMQVSDPDSQDYGRHLSMEQVDELVAPAVESVQTVLTWLAAEGVAVSRHTGNHDMIEVEVDVATAERLLNAKYYRYVHKATNRFALRTNSFELPSHVVEHVDVVAPTISLPGVHRIAAVRKQAPSPSNNVVTPDFLHQLYGVGDRESKAPSNHMAVASFLGQYISLSDLSSFFSQFDKPSTGDVPILVGPNEETNPGVEASLDIQYIMSGAVHVNTTVWSTAGQQPHAPANEPFLKWLTDVSSAPNAPSVFSISYADYENTVYLPYAQRVNTEFQKLGLRGISLIAGSGDGGVSGAQPQPCTKFVPTFPAASPYITAVGGTTGSKPETAAGLSGGGFSNYWQRPSFQDSAIDQYFQVAKELPPKSLYNATMAGFPDVGAQALNYQVVYRGSVMNVDGTSCATPTFAALVAMLNDVRLQGGKSTLGYLNPLLYKHPEAFNDITSGDNPGCGTNGFQAAAGWDPVTGLGSMNWPAWAAIVKQLQ